MNVEPVLLLASNLIGAFAGATIYQLRGRSRVAGFAIAFIGGPIGLLIAITMPPADQETATSE
ncbi:hypothetical protein [Hephaestia caeni]|uniref:hypothetical protein n=1 Tax=Hephaestia caeni TaxID=645617 RepID=UPI000E5C0B84|nr:hypothetical protein [Hephaestia caeni]